MTKTIITEDHVLPRPVERLPDYASAQSRRSLGDKLAEAFSLSATAATAIANAVVDPSGVRKAIGDTRDPEVERIAVPGGTLFGIRTTVWSRRVIPDPRNPRTLPSRRHPFAVDPGSGGEDAKFRPVPEPRSPNEANPQAAELLVEIESRHHLNWAAQHAASYVLAENDWRESIRSQGVMEAVWLVATTYEAQDGTEPVTALTTAEGSSRVTAVHKELGVRSSDVPYEENETGLRWHYKKLNQAFESGPSAADLIALRCERIPALILVGFRPHASGKTGFPTAVKSFVALRHVDPPKPWGEGPENESLADEVLDEMYRRELISATERSYYAGACTRSEARDAHLPNDPAARAAMIVRLLTNPDPQFAEAIRVAVTSQSTRKRITTKLANDLATALVLRAVADEPAKTDQIRRYMRHAFGKSVHRSAWAPTGRDADTLVKEATAEVRRAIADGSVDEPGPASLELAVRAAYPLVVSGRLNADRGTANNSQPDRRTPGEVLDAMRQTPQGVFQLGQALRDFAADRPIRAVNEAGEIKLLEDGSGDQSVNDIYLRGEFPPPGKARSARPGATPLERYQNRLSALSVAIDAVEQAFDELGSELGDDGRPIVESRGVDPRTAKAWRDLLGRIDEELVVWSRTFKRAFGSATSVAPQDDEADDGPFDPARDLGWDEESQDEETAAA